MVWDKDWITEAGCTWEEGEQHIDWKKWENTAILSCRKLDSIRRQMGRDKNSFDKNFETMKGMIIKLNVILKPHNYELCLMNWERWMGTDDRLGKSW